DAAPAAVLEALEAAGVDAPLWCVTRGAVSVAGEAPAAVGQAALWGMGRVAALEHPERFGGLADLAPDADAATAALLAAHLTEPGSEDQIAVRAAGLFGRRLVRTAVAPGDSGWRPHGTVLVVGGTRTMGARAARWLAREGAARLVLTTSPADSATDTEELRAELGRLGAEVTVAPYDGGDRDAARALLDGLTGLTAVVYADDTPADGPAAALAPVDTLAEAVTGRSLDAFVLFGSVAGVWGVRGRTDEAAGGAYVDALARALRAEGTPALAVSWNAWAELTDPSTTAHLRMNGLPVMDADAALTALAGAVADGSAAVTVADVRWDTFAPAHHETRPTALFDGLPEARTALAGAARDRAEGATASDGYGRWLLEQPAADRDDILLALVSEKAALVLGHADTTLVEPDLPFRDLGFDSLTAVDLRNQLTAATGITLPATLVFDHPNPAALAAHLRTELLGGATDTAAPVAAPAATGDDPIVIVGMACRFPGGVNSPEDLWQLVLDEVDAVGDFPADRGWDLDALAGDGPGRSATDQGGFLYDATDFDPGLFGVSPREAMVMDPQQRILLEASWEALERAGI
ncbi:beta-ketoacyl reductase, partial [Streptomyces sp. SID2888]